MPERLLLTHSFFQRPAGISESPPPHAGGRPGSAPVPSLRGVGPARSASPVSPPPPPKLQRPRSGRPRTLPLPFGVVDLFPSLVAPATAPPALSVGRAGGVRLAIRPHPHLGVNSGVRSRVPAARRPWVSPFLPHSDPSRLDASQARGRAPAGAGRSARTPSPSLNSSASFVSASHGELADTCLGRRRPRPLARARSLPLASKIRSLPLRTKVHGRPTVMK